jgi:hypothetical protein
MFRLLRVIIRPSNELTHDYLIPSARWDPVALTVCGVSICQPYKLQCAIIVYRTTYGYNATSV